MSATNSPQGRGGSLPVWMTLGAEFISAVAPRLPHFVLWQFEMNGATMVGPDLTTLEPDALLSRVVKLRSTARSLDLLSEDDEKLCARMFDELIEFAVQMSWPRPVTDEFLEDPTGAALLAEILKEVRKRVDDGPHEADVDGRDAPPAHKRDPHRSTSSASDTVGGVTFPQASDAPTWSVMQSAHFPNTVQTIVRYVGVDRMPAMLKAFSITDLNSWLVWSPAEIVHDVLRRARDRWLGGTGMAEAFGAYIDEAPRYRADG